MSTSLKSETVPLQAIYSRLLRIKNKLYGIEDKIDIAINGAAPKETSKADNEEFSLINLNDITLMIDSISDRIEYKFDTLSIGHDKPIK